MDSTTGQERGKLFVGPGEKVYEGMIVGECARNEDLVINVCKRKHITNIRASGSDEALKLTPPMILSLEQALEFISDDELVEITPKSIRLRKKILNTEQRAKVRAKGCPWAAGSENRGRFKNKRKTAESGDTARYGRPGCGPACQTAHSNRGRAQCRARTRRRRGRRVQPKAANR